MSQRAEQLISRHPDSAYSQAILQVAKAQEDYIVGLATGQTATNRQQGRVFSLRREFEPFTTPAQTDNGGTFAFSKIVLVHQADKFALPDTDLEFFNLMTPGARDNKDRRLRLVQETISQLGFSEEELDQLLPETRLREAVGQLQNLGISLGEAIDQAGIKINDAEKFIRRFIGQIADDRRLSRNLIDEKSYPKAAKDIAHQSHSAIETSAKDQWRQENSKFLSHPNNQWLDSDTVEQFAQATTNATHREFFVQTAGDTSESQDTRPTDWAAFVLTKTPDQFSPLDRKDWNIFSQGIVRSAQANKLHGVSLTCPGYKIAREEIRPDGTILSSSGLEIGPGTSIITQKVIDGHTPFILMAARSGLDTVRWDIGIAEFEALTKRNLALAAADSDSARQAAIAYFADQTNQGINSAVARLVAKITTLDPNLAIGIHPTVIKSGIGHKFNTTQLELFGTDIAPITINVGIAGQILGENFLANVDEAKKQAEADLQDPDFLKASTPSIKRRAAFYAGLKGHSEVDPNLEVYLPLYTEHLAEYRTMSQILAQLDSDDEPVIALLGDSYTMWTAPGTAKLAKLFASRTDDGRDYPGAV